MIKLNSGSANVAQLLHHRTLFREWMSLRGFRALHSPINNFSSILFASGLASFNLVQAHSDPTLIHLNLTSTTARTQTGFFQASELFCVYNRWCHFCKINIH